MNFVFVSPNFPLNFRRFCDRLSRDGATVLGIGDASYDSLGADLQASLAEYYRVNSLSDYDEMQRAIAYFISRHGTIDWLESNNEYWLEQDARLRTDFAITTGVDTAGVARFKSKRGMKAFYERAGVPSARSCRVSTPAAAADFVREVGGYPVFAKPDVGVGAEGTFKIEDDADLASFFEAKQMVPYVMEEYVTGDIYSYDAIIDQDGTPLFESSCCFPPSMARIVEQRLDFTYCTLPEVPEQLRERGRATVASFGVRARFVHMEFFRLEQEHPGLGGPGDFVGLEVNMRPAGGYTPDMMDIAHSTDVYQIWADMVCHGGRTLPRSGDDQYCVYVGRRDTHTYLHPFDDVLSHFGGDVRMSGRMPDAISDDMGNEFFMAREPDESAMEAFKEYALA
jgi:hypothetical protein